MLDGLRGIAALAVVLYHLNSYNAAKPFWFTPDGAIAVDFFFALSGFVLSRAHGEQLRSGQLSGAAFARLRIARVWPMLILGTIVGAALLGVAAPLPSTPEHSQLAPTILASFVGLPWISRDTTLWVNVVFCSLTGEIVVNFVFGAIYSRLSGKAFLSITAAALLVYVCWSIVNGDANPHFENMRTLAPSLIRVFGLFFVGVAIDRYRIADRLPSLPPAVAVVALAVALWTNALVPVDANYLYHIICSLVLVPLILLAGAAARVRFILPWRLLGDASFPIYAIHLPIVLAAVPILIQLGHLERNLFRLALFGALFVSALLIERYIDAPARKWLRAKIA